MRQSSRTATVLTNLDTDFATMDKLSFDITLKEIKMKDMKEMVDFFLSTNIFFHFSRKIFIVISIIFTTFRVCNFFHVNIAFMASMSRTSKLVRFVK